VVLVGVDLVVSDGDEDQDEERMCEESSGAWSMGSISSCDGGEARLKVERAAGASGVVSRRCFAARLSKLKTSVDALGYGEQRSVGLGCWSYLPSSETCVHSGSRADLRR
jgi:hypothetical protein